MKRSARHAARRVMGLLAPVVAAAFTLTTVSASAVTATDWPGYMGGPAHTSDNSADTAITPANVGSLAQRWRFPAGALASPTVADGYVFIGATSGWFYELNATTGAPVAKLFLGRQPHITCHARGFVATAAVAADRATGQDAVYAAAPDGYLYALSIPGLKVMWRSLIAKPSSRTNNYFQWSSPTVANNHVYVGISSNCDNPLIRGGVAGYNAATGRRFATFYSVPRGQLGGSVWTSVAVDSSGYVYAATGNSTNPSKPHLAVAIVKLNPANLKPLAHFTVPLSDRTKDNDFGGSPTIFGNLVGACNHNGIYYAVRRSSMTLAWEHRIGHHIGPGSVPAQCAAGGAYDGTYLYIAGPTTFIHGHTYHGSIRRLDANTGKFVWQTGLPNGVIGAPSMNGGGVLAVGTYDFTNTPNRLYLLDAGTGRIRRTLISGHFEFAQSVFAGGWLYTANYTGVYGWKLG